MVSTIDAEPSPSPFTNYLRGQSQLPTVGGAKIPAG